VGVVDQHRDRLLIGERGQQAQRRRPDREPVIRDAGLQRQRRGQRRSLRLGNLVQAAQRGPDQLEQRAERHLRLLLDAAGAQQPHPARLPGGVAEQRRLADPRFPREREQRAGARSRQGERLLDLPPLLLPPQHAAIVGTWYRGAHDRRRLGGPRKR
jgi:hypothetical protein